jgi:hypothetical protein
MLADAAFAAREITQHLPPRGRPSISPRGAMAAALPP